MAMPLYSDCGFFGFNPKPADPAAFCGVDTRLQDGMCVSTVDPKSDNAQAFHEGFREGASTVDPAAFCGADTRLTHEDSS
jgi:hypothetical protein